MDITVTRQGVDSVKLLNDAELSMYAGLSLSSEIVWTILKL